MNRSARIFLSLGLALAALTSVNHQPLEAQSGPVTLARATATEGEPMTEDRQHVWVSVGEGGGSP